jgi:hypothetical protein
MNSTQSDWADQSANQDPGHPQGQAAVQRGGHPARLPYKSPFLAGLLSTMPGIGQIYVGYYQQGFINLIVIAATITVLATGTADGVEPFFGLFLGFFWLYNIIDAARRANLYNVALEGGRPLEPGEDLQLPGHGGSLFGGVMLIIVGALLLLHTQFDLSLQWLENWWPAAVIVLGIYIVVQARRQPAGRE